MSISYVNVSCDEAVNAIKQYYIRQPVYNDSMPSENSDQPVTFEIDVKLNDMVTNGNYTMRKDKLIFPYGVKVHCKESRMVEFVEKLKQSNTDNIYELKYESKLEKFLQENL